MNINNSTFVPVKLPQVVHVRVHVGLGLLVVAGEGPVDVAAAWKQSNIRIKT